MDYLRRIPLALLAAFAAYLLLPLLYLVPDLGGDGVQMLYGIDLAAAVLLPIGLFVLANRSKVRDVEMGATLAAAAATGGALLFVGSAVLRDHGVISWMMLAASALEAIGFAVMIGRRYPALAIVELVITIGGSLAFRFLELPAAAFVVRAVVHVALEVTIVLLVSPPISATSPERDRSSLDRARQLAILSALLYLISLCVPAVRMRGLALFGPAEAKNALGIACLLYGWILFPGWLANPLMLVGAILLAVRRPRGAFVLGCIATISAVIAPIILLDSKDGAESMLVGFYLWFASVVTFTVAAYVRVKSRPLVVVDDSTSPV